MTRPAADAAASTSPGPPAVVPAPSPPSGPGPGRPGAGRWGTLGLPTLIVALAGAIRLFRLGVPGRLYFDEKYYANDAREYLWRGVEEVRAVHPPLGKWIIAAGVEVFGFDAFGWRIGAALAGTLTVGLVYLCARRLCATSWAAALATLLYAVDGLAFTMSRIAMLDVFSAFFVALAFWLLLVHRDARAAGHRGRRWLLLAGLALGGALATKWTGAAVIAAAGAFVVAVEIWCGRRNGRSWWRSTISAAPSLLACLVAVPVLVYLASYAGWFSNFEHTTPGRRLCAEGSCSAGPADVVDAWWDEQTEIYRFHRDLVPTHGYRSPAWTWPVLQRPVLYYFERCDPGVRSDDDGPCVVAPGNRAKILGLGNPAVWWPALASYPALAWLALRRRDWRAGVVLWFLVVQFVPLVLVGRTGFLFYLTPLVGFMCLGLAVVAERVVAHRPARAVRVLPAVLAVAAVAAFAYFYPVYAAVEAERSTLDARLWFDSWR